jgi:glycosyltransferase involved in cell wall biosynthesis
VTIAIPCYNAVQWLGVAVESALAQTAPACEIIIVDDGSTDGSLEIAQAFGGRVRLIAGEHRGGNAARNTALEAARGEWMQFLDADDFLEPPKLAQQFAEAGNGAEADVIFSPVLIDEAGTRVRSTLDPTHDIYAQWIAWELPQTGGALWRKDALLRIGGWKEGQPCCQEHELYARALMAGLRFVFGPSAHAVYRVWSEGTVCRRDPRQLVRVKTQLIDDMCKWLQARGYWTETHRRLAGRACFEMARTIAKYDPAEAAAYHRDRRAHGLMLPVGPAAPLRYRLVYHTLGFASAEKFAAAARH